jgi:hypothetical protein
MLYIKGVGFPAERSISADRESSTYIDWSHSDNKRIELTKETTYRGAEKSLARPGRKQATATEDFEFHISYL